VGLALIAAVRSNRADGRGRRPPLQHLSKAVATALWAVLTRMKLKGGSPITQRLDTARRLQGLLIALRKSPRSKLRRFTQTGRDGTPCRPIKACRGLLALPVPGFLISIACASGEARDGVTWPSRDYGWSRLTRGGATLQGRLGWRFWKGQLRGRAFVNWRRPVSISSAQPGRKGTDKPDTRQAVDRDRSDRASGRRERSRRWEWFV
jgi:hypothetical protein